MTNISYTALKTREQNRILIISLNRPDRRNSLNLQLVKELQQVFETTVNKDNIDCIILTGTGTSFCAGADLAYLRSLQGKTKEEHLDDSRHLLGMYKTIYYCPLPVIALVNGAAIGGGCGLVNICDFAIASEEAIFAYPEVRIGFTPAIVSVFLVKSIGYQHARELLLTGRVIKAKEAQKIGLVTRVVKSEDLLPEGMNLAKELMLNSPQSMRMTKEFLKYVNDAVEFDALLEDSAEFNARSRLTDDFAEGISAFLEKKKPRWQVK